MKLCINVRTEDTAKLQNWNICHSLNIELAQSVISKYYKTNYLVNGCGYSSWQWMVTGHWATILTNPEIMF